jgi:multisubunit Na+/H+ antiporter MnhB subunit
MATCPRCHGHLTDHHRCPRRRAKVAAEIILAALAGGLAALLVVALIDPGGGFTSLGPAAVTIASSAGIGLDRLMRG